MDIILGLVILIVILLWTIGSLLPVRETTKRVKYQAFRSNPAQNFDWDQNLTIRLS